MLSRVTASMGWHRDQVFRYIPDAIGISIALCAQHWLYLVVTKAVPQHRKWLDKLYFVSWVVIAFGSMPSSSFPYWGLWPWVKALSFGWGILCIAMSLVLLLFRGMERLSPAFDPGRREVLNVAKAAALAAPAGILGYGAVVERSNLHLREIKVPIKGLPKDLDGLKLVQITDIHLSPFFSSKELDRAIDIANETKAHIALVTGDLITARRDPLDLCVRQLKRLRADGPTFGCLGNHEIHADCEDEAQELGARVGIRFLRSESEVLRFGNAKLNLVGVDYQRKFEPYLAGTEALKQPDMPNILLSHNPDVFPVAAQKGFDLTIAGHTHGGQIAVEILGQVNFARFYTPYIYGLYEENGNSIYVSRGLGTVGMPVRVGAPPEASLIQLCAT